MSDKANRKRAAKACERALDTDFFKALCEPVRVSIMRRLIMIGCADVATIAKGLPQDRSVVSRHLAVLERVGIAQSKKQGRHIIYDLDGPAIVSRIETVLDAARSLATICCPTEEQDKKLSNRPRQ